MVKLDAWSATQPAKISRPEAIRRLIELGLEASDAEAMSKKKSPGKSG